MNGSVHEAVLLEETMLVLDVRAGGRYLDGTLGGATHTAELLRRSSPDGRVLSLDVDPVALARAGQNLQVYGKRWQGVESNFRFLDRIAREAEITPLDGVLLDLGLSSDELEDPLRGISFRIEGPLDMRLGIRANEDGLTAAEIVQTWPEAELLRILRDYGEERMAYRIVRRLIEARRKEKIVTTTQLAELIAGAVGKGYERGRIHPATRTFQALRIAVNDELGALEDAIQAARAVLKPGGRLAIISFHSLEDRIVKQAFKQAGWKAVTKKPVVASEAELLRNPRARSAKLRGAIKQ